MAAFIVNSEATKLLNSLKIGDKIQPDKWKQGVFAGLTAKNHNIKVAYKKQNGFAKDSIVSFDLLHGFMANGFNTID